MQKVFVHLADGFEEIEAVTIIDVLRRADIPVATVAIGDSLEVQGAHGITLHADQLFADTDYFEGSMLVLPGGGPGTERLAAHTGLAEKLRLFHRQNRWIAAICAAPTVLGRLGLLEGRKAACYPGCEDAMGGAKIVVEPLVVDGHIITSRGPATALTFSLALVKILAGANKAHQVAAGMLAQ